ncbi:MmcQ/YjbR family DNA-binding protein [Rhodovulum sp. MB263]|uniref:MmcQ/YjbR family DNA-binding protein n=1 Tax=Rhodovulum sp. (strain MB263) TaxID=308754 RepID=UPI001E63441B|nr:MmcQ/YjbR family DNA-binding protein [Rhodovulum sp. MB263]
MTETSDIPMTEDALCAFCDALPGAARSQPFGPGTEVWKVGGRIFALLAPGSGRISVKCADAEFAAMLIETGRAAKAPYLPRGGWIALGLGALSADELAHRLRESHATVRAGLPRRIREGLG